MRDRGFARTLICELERLGAVDIQFEHTRKHNRLRWWHSGRTMFYVLASSPGGGRYQQNALADIRRMIRSLM